MRSIIFSIIIPAIFLCFSGLYAQDLEYVSSLLWNEAYDIKVIDTLAYCGYRNGLVILNVSNPSEPTLVSQFYLQGGGTCIDVQGQYAYLTGIDFGLQIVDITNPLSPSLVGQYQLNRSIWSIDVDGIYAYIMEAYMMNIFDISNPEAPFFVGSYGGSGAFQGAMDIKAIGNLAFVADDYYALSIIDVSVPEAPVLLGRFEGESATAVAIDDSIAYLSLGESGLMALDISNLSLPSPIWHYDSIPDLWYNNDICVINSKLHLVGPLHYSIFDISNPYDPVFLSSIPTRGEKMEINDDYTYISRPGPYFGDGIEVIDILDTTNPMSIGEYKNVNRVNDVAIAEDYAIVAADKSGIRICDISNPINPQIVAGFDNFSAERLFIAGNRAYVSSLSDTLIILDVSNYLDPQILFSAPITNPSDVRVVDFEVRDDYEYLVVAGRNSPNFAILDISDSHNPEFISDFWLQGCSTNAIFLEGQYAYLVSDSSSNRHTVLSIIDISDPYNPELLGGCSQWHASGYWWAACEVSVYNNYAYLADGQAGFHVINVENPYNPYLVNTLISSGYVNDIHAANYRLFTANVTRGITVYGLEDPYFPYVISELNSATNLSRIKVWNNYIYSAEGQSFTIYRFGMTDIGEDFAILPASTSLSQNYPNPFNAQTQISYTLPSACPVKLNIYDILGRQVQTLFNGSQTAGDHSIIWNADSFASGTYFYHLTAGDKEFTKQMTLIK